MERPARGRATAAVLLLHGGQERGPEPDRAWRPPALRMYPFLWTLARAGRARGLVVAQLVYRSVGWNEGAPVADAVWALADLRRRHGEVPVALVGHSMGGRIAVHAASRPGVEAVACLAPWLPAGEPVEGLAGRDLMVVHGLAERVTDPALSVAFASRARPLARRVACFEVDGAGHAMLQRPSLWHDLVRGFVLGALGLAPTPAPVRDAFDRPADALAVRL